MKISYKPTFQQFSDNYLATYYSGGVKTLQRVAGGPLVMLAGTLVPVLAFDRTPFWWLRIPALLAGIYIFWRGLSYALGPLFNVFLVSLRREQLYEKNPAITTLEIRGEKLHVDQNGEQVSLPVKHIQTIQHRADSTWLLTFSDQMLYIPREGLISGDHDKFVAKLEELLTPDEEPDAKPAK
jgi:hypothetical protein